MVRTGPLTVRSAPVRYGASRDGAVQAPLARHTLEHVRAACFENKARARYKITHRLRDQNFARPGKPADARADMHSDSSEIVTDDLAFSGMQTATDLESERMHGASNCAGTANRAGGAVEGREEPI